MIYFEKKNYIIFMKKKIINRFFFLQKNFLKMIY